MAGFNLLKWLYKHSPVNFYAKFENTTIIKSINNTFYGYEFGYEFSDEDINKIRNTTQNFKRLTAVLLLLFYFFAIYGLLFNNYNYFMNPLPKLFLLCAVILITVIVLCGSSLLFKMYLKKNFGNFIRVKFPSSNFIENQSYSDFKLELIKIAVIFIIIFVLYITKAYLYFGTPYETSLNLINSEKYQDAEKVTTFWTKIMPMDSQWYSIRGYARFYLKNYNGAIEDFDKAYNLETDEFKSMNFDNKIYVKYFLKDYNSALVDFDKEIKKNSIDKNSFLWDKAQFLYNIKEYQKSLEIYNQLIENSQEDKIYLFAGRLYFERSEVLKKLGKYKQAKEDLETAKNLNLIPEFQNKIPEPSFLLNGV